MLHFWRSQVSYLPQQVFLIDNTLRSNVALGVDENLIDEVKLQQALKQARLLEMVEQMPNGVETQLGERGVKLSGGQRQRVAIARAFYHGRKVLVMDESTSSLDRETEKEITGTEFAQKRPENCEKDNIGRGHTERDPVDALPRVHEDGYKALETHPATKQ